MIYAINYAGSIYDFDDERMTASEARRQKVLTGGMTPEGAKQARRERDPEAWIAALDIAWRRAGLETPDDGFDGDQIDLERIATDTWDRVQRERKAKAPTAPPAGQPQEGDEQPAPADDDTPAGKKRTRSTTTS